VALVVAVEAVTVAAWAAVVTALLYLGLFFYAGRQVREAKQQVAEARRLREEQTRPFVIAEFIPGVMIKFRVRNIGSTVATNIRLTWLRWPHVSKEMLPHVPMWRSADDSVLFARGIRCLAPGQEIVTNFDLYRARLAERLPMGHTVTASYGNYAPGVRGRISAIRGYL
jgi:hypothetical protein